jgi:integrase
MCSPYRPKNSAKYWVRKRVPKEFKAIIGQSEIKRSLGTTDPKEARRRGPIICAEIDQIIASARRSLMMDVSDVQALSGQYLRERLSEIKADAINQNWEPDTFSLARERLTEALDRSLPSGMDEPEYRKTQTQRAAKWGLKAIQPTLDQHGLKPNERIKDRLGVEVFKAELEAYAGADAELHGDTSWQAPAYAHAAMLRDLTTLPELFAEFVKITPKLAARTRDSWKTYIERAHTFFDKKPAANITRRDVRAFADALLAGDKRATPKGKPLAGKTVKDNYIAALSVVYKFAIDREKLKEDPTFKIKIQTEKTKVIGYSREQVLTVLLASREPQSRRTRPEIVNVTRWAPWLAAFTGARIGELLWLERKDIRFTQGIAYINIQAGSDEGDARTVKTESSIRTVPLHPAIIKEGFLNYWRALPEGEKYLFPGEWSDQNDDRTKTPANKLRRWIKRQLPEADWHRLSPNHSFRHWLIAECRRAGIDEDERRVLTGHEAKDIHGRYGPSDIPALHDEIKKVPSPRHWQQHTAEEA